MKIVGYKNFNGRVRALPRRLYRPQNVRQLCDLVQRSKQVRVFRGLHVFNRLSVSECVMVDMKHFTSIRIHLLTKTVTIGAGVQVGTLVSALASHGLSLPVHVFTPCASVLGALSTGSHGSNIFYGSMSNLLLSAKLVLADGSVKTVTRRNKTLEAIRCGLGCLGILYSATLQCEPRYEYFQLTRSMPWATWVNIQEQLLPLFPYTIALVDPFHPRLQTTVQLIKKVSPGHGNTPVIDTPEHCSRYYLETELAFSWQQSYVGVAAVADYHRLHGGKRGIHTSDPLLVRYSGPDDTYISMSSKRGAVYVGTFLNESVPPRRATRFLKDLSASMVHRFRARPHYGKLHRLTHSDMIRLYGERYLAFVRIRARLDPTATFINPSLARFIKSPSV